VQEQNSSWSLCQTVAGESFNKFMEHLATAMYRGGRSKYYLMKLEGLALYARGVAPYGDRSEGDPGA
jgi:hypothetical protein